LQMYWHLSFLELLWKSLRPLKFLSSGALSKVNVSPLNSPRASLYEMVLSLPKMPPMVVGGRKNQGLTWWLCLANAAS
jgi:hypothetical protein